MTKPIKTVSLLIIMMMTFCGSKNMKNLTQWIPRDIDDWSAKSDDAFFNRETLFNHINGGAEPYLTYSFREALVRKYTGPDYNEIIVEIYDMARPGDAYGIFSIENADEEIGIGQGSEYGGGLLRFWKDRYFVSIITTGKEEKAKPVMMKIANMLDKRITSTGAKPSILGALSIKGFSIKKMQFFHTFPILNRLYFLADENILKLSDKTDCALGKYEINKNQVFLLIIKYENEGIAEEAHGLFKKSYIPESGESGMYKTENGRWTLCRRDKRHLIIVFDAPDSGSGKTLLSGVNIKEE